ncbi:hypothetical protein [Embleya hyalina]|uniref:Uncharacterized protein n=1 Tax=Embleya hyalina TaxID=516124 RepID=A0A401YMY3_9ACTN|nr:hypothetical protein [Embleya hyalina]GCD95948.1 hypothetical protein EHYA_03632 [Embleya hyalina]
MSRTLTQLNDILRPVAPPRVLEGVYTDDQHRRILDVLKQHGPWRTIIAQTFDSIEELVATSSGPDNDQVLDLTLDDVAGAHFRGFFARNSTVLYPELSDCFYNSRFLDLAKAYWGAEYARPTMMLFNFCGPHHSTLTSHLDAVTFRGIRYENSPTWLLNVMGRSGLFTDHLVKMAQVITWWYLGENGTFTYWPDGPLGDPKRLDHPLWNKGVVVQNEAMFHRGDPVGRLDERDTPGLKNRSLLGWDASRDDWAITTDGEAIRRYRPEEMRLLVHWNAEVYADRDELAKNMDHTDDLTHDIVFERLLADLRARGVEVAEPSDPMNDKDFIRALIATYTIAPTTDWATPGAV